MSFMSEGHKIKKAARWGYGDRGERITAMPGQV